MRKALLESISDVPARQSEPADAGYEPHEWERRLAEARQKREAVLQQRAARRDATPVRTVEPDDTGQDTPMAIEAFVAKVQSSETTPGVGTRATGARSWTAGVPAFAAGCLMGAVAVGVFAMTVASRTPPGPIAADAGPQAAPALAAIAPTSATAPVGASAASGPNDAAVSAPVTTDAAAEPPAQPSDAAIAGSNAPADEVRSVTANADDRSVPSAEGPATDAPTNGAATTAARPPAQFAMANAESPEPGAGWAALASAPPVAATPPPVSPLATATSRVVVLAPRSVPRSAGDEAVAAMRELGWPAGEPRVSPFTISKTHVRFYHPEDRPAAEELAAMFSASARDFTDYAQRPERGMLELWLAGRAPVRRQPARPALPPPVQMVADALGRLAQGVERSR